jgi:hypothetical protein
VLHAGFFFGLFFDHEYGGDMSVDFQWNTFHQKEKAYLIITLARTQEKILAI